MTDRLQQSRRLLSVFIFAALVLSGCGVFGGDDEIAQTADVITEARSVRVSAGERFFELDPASLLDAEGELRPNAISELESRVNDLSLSTADPTNAGVFFEDGLFVVNPSIPGSMPDIAALAAAFLGNDVTEVDVPLAVLPAAVGDDDAAVFASGLNQRIAGGLDVLVGGQTRSISASAIGDATTIDVVDNDWVVSVNYDELADDLTQAFPDVGTEGGEASFDIEPGEGDEPDTVVIIPGTPGTACCGQPSADRIRSALTGESDMAQLSLAVAEGSRGATWAEGLGITELVGSFTTDYTPGQDRNINIQRIAELTQGMIIEPGDTWSLNDRVGQRTRDNGFVPAGTIINGHLSESVGGGISQYATTLFNAAFFAGLEYGDYQAHSIYFSRYPYGREATISWPAPQLEIHNPTPYGILIWPTTTSSGITVDLYSTKWADAEQTGQRESTVQVACTRVTTERTRTFVDGTVDVDSVFAVYRREGIGCNGEPTDDPDAPPTTTTTTLPVDPNAPPVDPNAPPGEGTQPGGPNAPTAPTVTAPDAQPNQPADQPAQPAPGPQPAPQPVDDTAEQPNQPNQPEQPPETLQPAQPSEPSPPQPPETLQPALPEEPQQPEEPPVASTEPPADNAAGETPEPAEIAADAPEDAA